MLKPSIDRCIEECYQTIVSSKNKKIKDLVSKICKEFPEIHQKEALKITVKEMIIGLLDEEMEEEFELDFIITYLKEFYDNITAMKDSYKFKVTVEGFEDEVYRMIKVPVMFSLSDVAYLVLAAFQAKGNHLFEIIYKNKRFDLAASSDYDLAEMFLKKGSVIKLNYDFKEDYNFIITFKEEVTEKYSGNAYLNAVLDGKGFGIWEDAKYEMDLFYHDKKQFENYIKENSLNEDAYPTKQRFDLDVCNGNLAEEIMSIRMAYEQDGADEISF